MSNLLDSKREKDLEFLGKVFPKKVINRTRDLSRKLDKGSEGKGDNYRQCLLALISNDTCLEAYREVNKTPLLAGFCLNFLETRLAKIVYSNEKELGKKKRELLAELSTQETIEKEMEIALDLYSKSKKRLDDLDNGKPESSLVGGFGTVLDAVKKELDKDEKETSDSDKEAEMFSELLDLLGGKGDSSSRAKDLREHFSEKVWKKAESLMAKSEKACEGKSEKYRKAYRVVMCNEIAIDALKKENTDDLNVVMFIQIVDDGDPIWNYNISKMTEANIPDWNDREAVERKLSKATRVLEGSKLGLKKVNKVDSFVRGTDKDSVWEWAARSKHIRKHFSEKVWKKAETLLDNVEKECRGKSKLYTEHRCNVLGNELYLDALKRKHENDRLTAGYLGAVVDEQYKDPDYIKGIIVINRPDYSDKMEMKARVAKAERVLEGSKKVLGRVERLGDVSAEGADNSAELLIKLLEAVVKGK